MKEKKKTNKTLGQGNGSMGNVLTLQAQGPQFDPQTQENMLDMMAHACNPRRQKKETLGTCCKSGWTCWRASAPGRDLLSEEADSVPENGI